MKKSLLVLALLFSLVSFAQSPADKSFPPEELFALGSYYYPEQWDSSQWERDLKKMSEMGIKFTHFAEFAWSMMEPEEGEYHFEWLDRAVSLAEKYGLKVIMCTPTPTPPVWLSKKYPDILIQRDNGVTIQHGRRQHASWSSDRYRHYVENIVSRLAIHYGNNPTVIGWQIDNEPGHYGVVDYSENAQAKFRVWNGYLKQTLYGFSVAASSNIYSKGNFGFAPVLYQDGSVGVSFQDVTGAPESGCYLAIALFDGQQFLTGTLKDCILFPDIALFR